MARRVTAGHEALRQSERPTDPSPDDPFKLRVTRPHPNLDRRVGEVWGHGSEEEMVALAREKRLVYDDSYEFTVVEK
jgi:hypothetical protein